MLHTNFQEPIKSKKREEFWRPERVRTFYASHKGCASKARSFVVARRDNEFLKFCISKRNFFRATAVSYLFISEGNRRSEAIIFVETRPRKVSRPALSIKRAVGEGAAARGGGDGAPLGNGGARLCVCAPVP